MSEVKCGKKAYYEYAKLAAIMVIDPFTKEVVFYTKYAPRNTSKITMLFNSLYESYGGIVYLCFNGDLKFEIYKGIGGRKTYFDTPEEIDFLKEYINI